MYSALLKRGKEVGKKGWKKGGKEERGKEGGGWEEGEGEGEGREGGGFPGEMFPGKLAEHWGSRRQRKLRAEVGFR